MVSIRSRRKVFSSKPFLMLALILMFGIMPVLAAAEQAQQQAAPAVQEPAPQAEAPAAPAIKGDAEIGRQLYLGEKSLQNGGPPCISCHNLGVGALGGGSLGPDLTKISTNESKWTFVAPAWINGGGSPTMGPIFGAKNITDEEVEHIRAFFSTRANEPVVNQGGMFAGIGFLGFIAILILFSIIWSNRYRNRNRGTAHDALWRNYGGKGGR